MATIVVSPHTGPGLVDHTLLNANFAAVNIVSMTHAERDAIEAPEEGRIIYDSSYKRLCLYDGKQWLAITASHAPLEAPPIEER